MNMYWVYLVIFILIIFTPKLVHEGVVFFQEEDLESLIIFGFGMLAFLLYLTKEKALLRIVREKLHLQKQTNLITKDLSDSYSYIGEMNRKFDIVKELLYRLPKTSIEGLRRLEKDDNHLYRPIIEAVQLLSKADPVSLRFVHAGDRTMEKIVEKEAYPEFAPFTAEVLLDAHKTFWEEKECMVIRSPHQAGKIVVFVIFPKRTNRVEDGEIFKILASQALFLYGMEHRTLAGETKEV